eukprot:423454_1
MSLVHIVGRNTFGEFGIGHKRCVRKSIPLNAVSNIRDIKCGYGYNIYIDTSNNYFVAGNNQHGECGVHKVTKKKKVTKKRKPASKKKGRKNQNGKCIVNPQHFQYFSNQQIEIKQVFATLGGCVTFWITKSNKIYANGWNNKYQIGIKEGKKK